MQLISVVVGIQLAALPLQLVYLGPDTPPPPLLCERVHAHVCICVCVCAFNPCAGMQKQVYIGGPVCPLSEIQV